MQTTTAAPKWPTQAGRDAFYGDPRGVAGAVNPKWEAQNIVRVEFPWDAYLAWDTHTRVKTVRMHRLCADSLTRVLRAIWRAAGMRQAVVEQWGVHLFGGGYEFRAKRGGTSLSSHAWGCAIDLDPLRNAYGNTSPRFGTIPEVLQAFEDEGWTWGGPWRPKADGMHWQAASVR